MAAVSASRSRRPTFTSGSSASISERARLPRIAVCHMAKRGGPWPLNLAGRHPVQTTSCRPRLAAKRLLSPTADVRMSSSRRSRTPEIRPSQASGHQATPRRLSASVQVIRRAIHCLRSCQSRDGGVPAVTRLIGFRGLLRATIAVVWTLSGQDYLLSFGFGGRMSAVAGTGQSRFGRFTSELDVPHRRTDVDAESFLGADSELLCRSL
jgi:hypothetical protein